MTPSLVMTSPDPENPTPNPQPKKLWGVTGDAPPVPAESDLWELGKEANKSQPIPNDPPSVASQIPLVGRSFQKTENRKRFGVHLDIHTKGPAKEAESDIVPVRGVESEFGKLEDWGDYETSQGAVTTADSEPTAVGGEAPVTDVPEPLLEEMLDDSGQPGAKPEADAMPARMPMKIGEWAALVILGLMLIALSIGAYIWSIHLLPEETPRWNSVNFPVKGARIEIKNANTYWRAPVLEGPDKDPIRRGTRLIPVVDIDLTGGPAAVRVIFRDEEGQSVGDPIFRTVSAGRLALASTAGFDDPGMHAAYRTEDLEPWSVEISEAASTDAPGSGYALILKMNISSELR